MHLALRRPRLISDPRGKTVSLFAHALGTAEGAFLWKLREQGSVSSLCLDDEKVTAYSYIVGNKEKLLIKAKRNPNGLRFGDLETVLRQCGWTFDHQTGSHRFWYSPRKHRISLQEARDGKAKGYQVRQFLEQYEKETSYEK